MAHTCFSFPSLISSNFLSHSPSRSPAHLALRRLPLLLAVAWGSTLSVQAQTVQIAAGPKLQEVVVSGSRSEQISDEIPASIDVLNAQTLEAQQVHDIRDVAKELPNVSVKRAPARFSLAGGNTGRDGNSGFNIRGLDGNRVLMLTDGIRMPRSYVFSANAFGRDYLDIGLVKRVEIVRGPASVLYGSDGVAGLVNFITHDPADFLTGGKAVGGRASVGYSGDDKGVSVGGTVAGRANDVAEWLISANTTRADGLRNMGTNDAANVDRTTPNPETNRNNAILGKLVLRPSTQQKHVVTLEHVDKKAAYELLSARAKPPLTATSTLGSNAENTLNRDRATWDARYQVNAPLMDSLQTVLAYQAANSREYVTEDRNTAADRVRDTAYKEATWQANVQAQKTLRLSPDLAHKLTYGFDYTAAKITNNVTGVTPPTGETFPLKRFPDTRESSSAVYVQDEIISDRFTVVPGVRIDRFKLDASQSGFGGVATSLSGSAVSPKLGLMFRATPEWSVYGNYASGFKAPNANQLNGFFENPTSYYKTISNPNLKPEKSQNFELGLRGRLDRLTLDAAVFTGRFKNLIQDTVLVSGNFTQANPGVYQSINVGQARISGFELKGLMDWGRVGRAGEVGIASPFAYGQTKGTDTSSGKPINSINPSKLVLGVRATAAQWTASLDAVHHAAKKSADIDPTALATQFATPAATTLDLRGQWRIRKDLRLNMAVVNLANKKYWNWADVNGLASTSTVLDAYTQPGRHLNVSLVADF